MKEISLAIDLGTKTTGVSILNIGTENEISALDAFVINVDEKKIQFSQEDRRSKRHAIRNQKRFKLARRLTENVLEDHISRSLTQEEKIQIRHYLNKRGYNFISSDSKTFLDHVSVDEFSSIIDYFLQNNSDDYKDFKTNEDIKLSSVIQDYIQYLSENTNKLEDLYKILNDLFDKKNDLQLKTFTKEIQEKLSADITKKKIILSLKESTENGVKYFGLNSLLGEIQKSIVNGAYSRKQYFNNIYEDMQNDTTLLSLNIDINKLCIFICNVSNLQLRILRKYFNNKDIKGTTIYVDNNKFISYYAKWVKSFPAKNSIDKQYKHDITTDIKATKKDKSIYNTTIFELLSTLDPIKTIPPFENQNNRTPPKDKTLLLSYKKLHIDYPNWQKWVELLKKDNENTDLLENLKEICTIKDRKTENKQPKDEDLQLKQDAYFLQRVLDRSRSLCPYDLVGLYANHKNTDKNRNQKKEQNLEIILGSSHKYEFENFVKQYKELIDQARSGLYQEENNILEVANINPPHKNKTTYDVIKSILGLDYSKTIDINEFIKFLETEKIGRSTLKGLIKSYEDLRKENSENTSKANEFKWKLDKLLKHINDDDAKKKIETLIKNMNLSADFKKIIHINTIVDEINKFFGNTTKPENYNNLYSLSQIYTVLYNDTNGFSRNCKAIIKENAWRMKTTEWIHEKTGEVFQVANCQRLSADTIRPFDGVLERLLSNTSLKISQEIIKVLNSNIKNNDDQFKLSIVIEENNFDSSADLSYLKGNNNKGDEIKKKQAKFNQSKDKRIKDLNSTCPITGKPIDTKGEIDHIIPRAYSLKNYQRIFNHEANLIYMTSTGNQKKSNKPTKLVDLHDNYLQEIFNTTNILQIQEKIEQTVLNISKKKAVQVRFQALDQDDQTMLRHALFLSQNNQAYKYAIDMLKSQGRMNRVNGTQGWVVRKIRDDIQKSYPNAIFTVDKINNLEISDLRKAIERDHEEYQAYAKSDKSQEKFSHIIDATLAFMIKIWDSKKPALSEEKIDVSILNNVKDYYKDKEVIMSSRTQFELSQHNILHQRTLHKENSLGEAFLPLGIYKGELYLGYSLEEGYFAKIDYKITKAGVKNYTKYDNLIPFFKLDKLTKQGEDRKINTINDLISLYGNDKEWVRLVINKPKAIEFMFNVCSNIKKSQKIYQLDTKQLTALYQIIKKTLSYWTQRSKISLATITKDNIIQDKYLLSSKQQKNKITLPLFRNWNTLVKVLNTSINKNVDFTYNELVESLKSTSKTASEISKTIKKANDEDLLELENTLKPLTEEKEILEEEKQQREKAFESASNSIINKGSNLTKHKKARKHNSLLTTTTPTSNVLRVRRRTPDGGYIYQILTLDNYKGVKTGIYTDKDDNIINKKAVYHKFLNSKNIATDEIDDEINYNDKDLTFTLSEKKKK